eukprot:CAMPEP_0176326314 /NCGR_PEP_ID=MMETSP0121_2-20121125/73862_1 /TAXON_ID=160619 /ORGANISM="Kryptoperidinium foliaceum, Strain CCMP 1326" /LENGTH=59 /DNA_ID=CAMNT_0017668907 /DNA_START=7 /DNA_END=183 /DNA_ORIENTATION=+
MARAARVTIRRDIEATILREESSGLKSLLDLVCDVVVTLDDAMTIRGGAKDFAALVMLQ